MRKLFDEYGDILLAIIISIVILTVFMGLLQVKVVRISADTIGGSINEANIINGNKVSIKDFEVKDGVCQVGKAFNYSDRVSAHNSKDEDIGQFVNILGTLDTSKVGEKEITYILRYNGESLTAKAKLFIEEGEEENNEKYD